MARGQRGLLLISRFFRDARKEVAEPVPKNKISKQSTVSQDHLIKVLQTRNVRGFRVMKSGEAPLIRYTRRDQPETRPASS